VGARNDKLRTTAGECSVPHVSGQQL